MDDRPISSHDRWASARAHFAPSPEPLPVYKHVGPIGWLARACAFWFALGLFAYGLWCA